MTAGRRLLSKRCLPRRHWSKTRGGSTTKTVHGLLVSRRTDDDKATGDVVAGSHRRLKLLSVEDQYPTLAARWGT